ncbi:hypothetical protein IWW54_004188, partial [Coemansia sp. RSA 2705]
MDTVKCDASTRRSSKTSSALRLSTGTIQCADPDLKREALSELFDHCMTPLASPRPLCSSDGLGHRRSRLGQQRARPLSAAPALDLTILTAAPVEVASGLMSPLTPSRVDAGAYFADAFGSTGGADDECGS